jgi:hypothetical protein
MAKNPGKSFEDDIKESIPSNCFVQRLKDGSSTGTSEAPRRIKTNNICDFIVFDEKWLHLWELKSHKGNSIPTSPKTNEKGDITHYGVIKINQLEGLMNEHQKKNVSTGFIFNLRDKLKTYFVEAIAVHRALVLENKKSLNLEWIERNGMLIPQKLKGRSKIHYNYDLSCLLDN